MYKNNPRTNSPSASILPDILYAWRGQSVLITDPKGWVSGRNGTGFFFRGTRFLQKMRFLINGSEPGHCSSARIDFNTFEFYFIYPTVETGATGGSGSGMLHKKEGISERGLDIRLKYMVCPAGIDMKMVITNRWDQNIHFETVWEFGADYISFDDTYSEKSSENRSKSGNSDDGIYFENQNEKLPLATKIHISSEYPWTFSNNCIRSTFRAVKGAQITTVMHIRAVDLLQRLDEEDARLREQRLNNWYERISTLSSPDNNPFITLTNSSMAAIGFAATLEGAHDEWLAPSAGYPLYSFLFGRDALTTGWMSAMFDCGEALDHTLTKLGRLQGKKVDVFRDEEPGRIIQQARNDPVSRSGSTPFDRYYGDFASPLMYVISLAHLYAWTGRLDDVRRHWDTCRRALDWAQRYGDRDNDGFLEYQTQSKFGPRNQGWKDSENAVVYENGTLVPPPIAPCEIQGYYFAALQAASLFSFLLGARWDAVSYMKRALRLKRAFNREFWSADGGYVGFGLDAQKRLIRVRTSNMGQCLATGIIDNDKIPSVVQALFSSDLYSGWGIRTLSTSNPSYNPLSYHLGSVWPVENASTAFGLRRYGFDSEAMALIKANYDLAQLWENGWIPECIGGYERKPYTHPGVYPRANAPQTWNVAAFGLFTHILLGLQPVAPLRILFVDPILPPWLPEIELKNLRIGGATLSLQFCRKKTGKTIVRITNKKGHIKVMRQPPVNSLSASICQRVAPVLKGVLIGKV